LILGVVKDTVPPDEASTQAADDKAGMPVAAIIRIGAPGQAVAIA
jgi:hypothetical protein